MSTRIATAAHLLSIPAHSTISSATDASQNDDHEEE